VGLKQQINAAVGAHGMWKAKLRTAIESGHCDVSVAAIRDDHRCTFGSWLHGEARKAGMKNRAQYQTCVDLHKRFHGAAADVVSLALAGKKNEAQTAASAGGEFGRASAELTTAMLIWANTED
jgi:methyl-accepting chemotaxis protein